ncbi:PREDICTED: probable membrane-associated kinase regulator 4 [Ipomoea nil]|uniref:probable membrane-associated kinase regulator 4 n=1 Tax=Ipomoea nil TaxID=35883 RepID=UPI0009013C2D|nr:PREDICTED: probable membrane-associated kinase regulator 4 [Ipomoea nil]
MAKNSTSDPPLKHHNVAEEEEEEEDYIDMEVNSSSSPQIREFEFQMGSICVEKESSTSPADELFYRGKLLPLHLPPRLQMVQKLIQTTPTTIEEEEEESFCGMPFISTATSSTAPSTDTSTPMESCNISPSESCRVSCELNPDDCYFEWSNEFSTFINSHHPKKSWAKKLKLVKQSLISQKLKASKAYLKGLFSKSGCSDESSCCNHPESDQQGLNNAQDFSSNKYMKVGMRPSLPYIGKCPHPTIASVIKSGERDGGVEDTLSNPRRSFSAAIKRHSPTKCLSSSSSFSSGTSSSSSSSSIAFISNGCYELNFLKRSSSDTSEIEGSIQAAIAHCKKSQDLSSSRKPLPENAACSLSAPKIVACEVQGRQGACSI